MALTYKTDVITLNAANTDFTILTASASSTLVKNISWIHDDHNTNIILSITKSGGSKIPIGEYSATANTSTKIWTDVLPLEANDVLHLQSDHISGTDVGYCVISYVEDTASVAGQSIAVHTDVSISGISDGQVLEWNNSTTQFEPATASGGATDTDGLSEGSTNLYFTDARVAANSAVTANTAKVGITTQQAADITANNAKTGITAQQASDITTNNAKISYTDASAVAANTAKVGITTQQASDITTNTTKISYPSADSTKLSNIEANADVTTTANVTAAGAVMDSEIANLAQVKAFDSSDYADDAQGALADTAQQPPSEGAFVNGDKTKLDQIASGATVNSPDSILKARANHTGTQLHSTISDFDSATNTLISNARTEYDFSTLETDRNLTMASDVSQSTSLICDVLGDAVAARNNANAKKLLGWHTGNGTVVLRGMIDYGSQIAATAGQALWLGASGTVSASAPTTTDEYSRIIGHYIGAGQGGTEMVYFNPSPDWIQID